MDGPGQDQRHFFTSFIILNDKSFGWKKIWNWCTGKKVPKWLFGKKIATLPLLSLCVNFKNFFGQMTSYWVLWKTYYTLFLKMCLRPCPGLSMYLSERINWIISSFPHRISKILFVLGSWDDFGSLGCRIGEC